MAGVNEVPDVAIPASLLPRDGRFGSGPARVRPAQLDALLAANPSVLGTSHRQPPVLDLVRRVQAGIARLLGAPDGYEVVLGNGGSTAFWDVAALNLVRERSQHLVHGEFSERFATATTRAPFLANPDVRRADPGSASQPAALEGIDAYCWPQNETSTGVALPVRRVAEADDDALVLIDATSAAGGLAVDLSQVDAYYLAPQKNLGSDGGLWIAVLSPAAIERAHALAGSRWVPASLDLPTAIAASRKHQTYNTPAIATLVLLAEQLDWIDAQGGLAWASARTAESARRVYAWAQARDWAAPFVAEPRLRSSVVATIDLDESVDAAAVRAVLRAHGVVDVEPYRALARNQVRIGMFAAVDPDDVSALTACVDHVVAAL